jgi:hypothetical protein
MMLRLFFFLVMLAGVGLGIAYPLVVENASGREVGSWRVFDRSSGFMEAEVALAPADAPIRVLVDMVAGAGYRPVSARTALTVTASTGGRTVLARTLDFIDATPRNTASPQSGATAYRADAGLIDSVEEGAYRIVVGPGDADDLDMRSVDLILRSGAAEADRRAVPAGYILMAIGFVGLVNALRRRSAGRPRSDPPPPKWGRG